MDPIEWLRRRKAGFNSLSEPEVSAVLHFTLLWSLYEAELLGKHGSERGIVRCVRAWWEMGVLNDSRFSVELSYFKNRYFINGEPSGHFKGLRVCRLRNKNQEMVKKVLSGAEQGPVESVSALFLVIYRLRNNLFHGEKWGDELRGQQQNFQHANAALIKALELDWRMSRACG